MQMNGYKFGCDYAKRKFETHSVTGLDVVVKIHKIEISCEDELIRFHWKKISVSPLGAEIECLQEGYFDRYHSEAADKHDEFKQSDVMALMRTKLETDYLSLISSDLSNFPSCLNQE